MNHTPGAATRPRDAGSAGIVVLAALAFAGSIVLGVARFGQVAVARARADTAADAAVLAAGADLALGGSDDTACAAARDTAKDNGAAVVRCAIAEASVDVTVTITAGEHHARGHARVMLAADEPAGNDG